MKLRKTAIAVAIAGVAAAPMMASAATTISGVVEVKLAGTDAEDANGDTVDPDIQAGDVRVGIVSEHELNSGLTGYGSIKLTVDDLLGEIGGTDGATVISADPTTDGEDQTVQAGGTVKADDIYVGVKGGFGDVRVGEIPLAVEYGQLANDIHDVGGDVGDGMSYTGTFGMFSLGLNYSPSNDSDMFGAGVKFNVAGATIGVGFEDRDEKANVAVGASYAIAGVSLAVQYWANEQDFDPDVVIDTEADDQVDASGFDIDDTTNIAVKLGYGIYGVSLGLTYSLLETQTGALNAAGTGLVGVDGEETVIRLDAGYDLGGGLSVSTRIDNTSDDNDDTDDVIAYRFQLAKSF